jgi:hypothetical protein
MKPECIIYTVGITIGVGDLHAKDVVKALIDLGLLFFIVIVPIYSVQGY